MPNSSKLVAADMSQLELRISAYMSRDPVMMDILRSGRDMHCVTAQAIFGTKDELRVRDGGSLSDAMRDTGKVYNYLSGYGGHANKAIEVIEKRVLSDPSSGMTVPTLAEAREAITASKRLYAQYWKWVGWTILRARENGYSETAFGRPRYSQFIDSPNQDDRAEAERALVNHCIQGTAADLMKMAMINISKDGLMNERGQMVLQVHDEIVSIVASDHVRWYAERIEKHMELSQPFEPYVRLAVDVNSGRTWKDCHK